MTDKPDQPEKPDRFDQETFRRLVEEGQKLAEEFDKVSRPMRILTPEDWLRRSR